MITNAEETAVRKCYCQYCGSGRDYTDYDVVPNGNGNGFVSHAQCEVCGRDAYSVIPIADCTPVQRKRANQIARANGYGRATAVVWATLEDSECPDVVDGAYCGYRKKTTGQYVPNAYRNKGWSSVYYQHAFCIVSMFLNPYK